MRRRPPAEVVKKVFGAIIESVSHWVTGSANLIEGGVKKLFGEGEKEMKPESATPSPRSPSDPRP